jgi:hypothetical protein
MTAPFNPTELARKAAYKLKRHYPALRSITEAERGGVES